MQLPKTRTEQAFEPAKICRNYPGNRHHSQSQYRIDQEIQAEKADRTCFFINPYAQRETGQRRTHCREDFTDPDEQIFSHNFMYWPIIKNVLIF